MAERRRQRRSEVGVVGLGWFGGQVADALVRLGHEVLAVDIDSSVVEKWKESLTYVVQADATQARVLRQLGIDQYRVVVVGIGSIEGSALTVLALADLGVPEIWARSTSTPHSEILSAIGATRVIFPESDMGDRVARVVTTRMLDFTEFHPSLAVGLTKAPRELHGRTLGESSLRQKYGVTVVAVRAPQGEFALANRDTRIEPDCLLVVAGRPDQLTGFAAGT